MRGPDEKGYAQMAVRLTDIVAADMTNDNSESPLSGRTDCPPLQLESSVSSSDTVDIKPENHAVIDDNSTANSTTPTSSSYLVPRSYDGLRTSPGAESMDSTHSNDPLWPQKESRQKVAVLEGKDEQDGGLKKGKRGLHNYVLYHNALLLMKFIGKKSSKNSLLKK